MYTIVGFEKIDYVNKSNRRVQGIKIHCTYKNSENALGLCVEAFYMNGDFDTIIDRYNLNIGDCINPLYNKYGNVQGVEIITKGE